MVNLSNSVEETEALASDFIKKLAEKDDDNGATIIGLYGDLGSGKTAFTKGVANALKVEEAVTSPTFVIEKIYRLVGNKRWSNMIHVDAYRLESGNELITLGWKELIKNKNNLVFIEWPQNIADIMPQNHIKIYFSFIDMNTRGIDIGE